MTTEEVKLLDGEYTLAAPAPDSVAECVALTGEESVVDNYVANLRYRNWYPRVYSKTSEAIKTEFPKAEKSRTKVEGKEDKVVMESDMDHLRRYITDPQNGEENREKLAAIFAPLCQNEPLYVKGERAGKGAQVAQKYIDGATAKFAAGEESVAKTVATIEGRVPGYKVGRDADGNVTVDSLARGISNLNRQLAAEREKELATALA